MFIKHDYWKSIYEGGVVKSSQSFWRYSSEFSGHKLVMWWVRHQRWMQQLYRCRDGIGMSQCEHVASMYTANMLDSTIVVVEGWRELNYFISKCDINQSHQISQPSIYFQLMYKYWAADIIPSLYLSLCLTTLVQFN